MTYAKIINNNFGSYPYRIGLNTLAHNGETFEADQKCGPGGLYYCEIKNVMKWLDYGDTLCIVKPVGQIVTVDRKFKTDRLEIVSMMSLKKIETWEFLIEIGVDVHASGYAFRHFIANGNVEIVKFLVGRGADVRMDDTAISWTAERGHFEVVKFLAECGLCVCVCNNYALRHAAENGHLEIVKFLVERGADVSVDNYYAFRMAVRNGHLEVVKFLIEYCEDILADQYAMKWIIIRGHFEVSAYLKDIMAHR